MQTRSPGIAGLSALAFASGIISIVAGWWLMLGGTIGSAFGVDIGMPVLIAGALMFALGLVELGVGYGFWRTKPWAWTAGLAVFTVSILVDVASVVFAEAAPYSVVVGILIAAVAIWYLLRPKVRMTFAR
jgi:hypothetical protein